MNTTDTGMSDGSPRGSSARKRRRDGVALKPVFAFACRMAQAPHRGETIYNAATRGQAKQAHYRSVCDAWPDAFRFTDVRVRKIGAAQSSEAFLLTAAARGKPQVRCGDPVTVNGQHGTIVGHNASANFEVLFDAGSPHAGQTLNVHPDEVELLNPEVSHG